MFKRKNKTKIIALVMAMAVGQVLPSTAVAQPGGGLLGKGNTPETEAKHGLFGISWLGSYGIFTEEFGYEEDEGYDIETEQFGQEGPLGSGLFIMAAAGVAYAFSKRKKNNKNSIKE